MTHRAFYVSVLFFFLALSVVALARFGGACSCRVFGYVRGLCPLVYLIPLRGLEGGLETARDDDDDDVRRRDDDDVRRRGRTRR